MDLTIAQFVNAATGKSGTLEWAGSSSWATVRVSWSETYDASKNQSVVSITGVDVKSTNWYGVTYYPDLAILIDGTTVITMNSLTGTHSVRISAQNTWCAIQGGSTTGSKTVTHSADGTKSINITIRGNRYEDDNSYECGRFYTSDGSHGNGWYVTGSKSITLTSITTYKLSVSAGTGSNITVNRTSSGYASTGNLSNGARLYKGDTLKITFTPSTNYAISTHIVNGSTFTSGGTHTVSANVSVVATAQVLASSVGATNANIGSTSTISPPWATQQ